MCPQACWAKVHGSKNTVSLRLMLFPHDKQHREKHRYAHTETIGCEKALIFPSDCSKAPSDHCLRGDDNQNKREERSRTSEHLRVEHRFAVDGQFPQIHHWIATDRQIEMQQQPGARAEQLDRMVDSSS